MSQKIQEDFKKELQKPKDSVSSSSSESSSESSEGSQSKYKKKVQQFTNNHLNDQDKNESSANTNKNYKQRSRSNSSLRSRSHKKHKRERSFKRSRSKSPQKHKHRSDKRTENYSRDRQERKHKKRSRSRDKKDRRQSRDRRQGRNRRQSRDGRNDRDRDYRRRDRDYDRRDRGRSRQRGKDKNEQKVIPMQIPVPMNLPVTLAPGERRRRQRSRSPLSYYKRNQNNNQGQFWDSFSWVPRMNYTPNVSSTALVNTKKMRRLLITNIPYEMGISKENLKELLTRYMTKNYLKDSMNNCPVRDVELNEQEHTAAVQLSSVEETCRMCKLEKIQLFEGYINGVIRLGDSLYGNSIVTQAQNAAQAQAAAFAAINVLQNKKTAFNMDVNLNKKEDASTLIRVTNAVTPYMSTHLTAQQWQEYYEDLVQGFSQYGKIVHDWFVKDSQKDICADAGNLFIEYESQEEAMKAMEEMQGRVYDERSISLFYVPRQLYYKNFKKGMTPPQIKTPPKPQQESRYFIMPQISKSSHIAQKQS